MSLLQKYLYHLSLLCLVSFSFVVCNTPISANEDLPLKTYFENIYTVDSEAQTFVKKHIVLENGVGEKYVTEYALEVSAVEITDLAVYDSNDEDIEYETSNTDNTTVIRIIFEEPVVGRGKKREFTVTYVQPDIARVNGRILEVGIPGIRITPDIQKYETILEISEVFDTPTIINPEHQKINKTSAFTKYIFNDIESQSSGISAIFGDSQTMGFTLDYYLQNNNSTKGISQISLPPDTAYQTIQYSEITPEPKSTDLDADGNWLATYILEPNQTTHVVVKGKVDLFLSPDERHGLPIEDKKLYLKETKYWNTSDPVIQSLSQRYQTPESIYQYLVREFSFKTQDDSKPRRGGAEVVVSHERLSTVDFVDTYISIARAAGIPAREVQGYAYSNNQKIRPTMARNGLHLWVEYYNEEQNRWIPIDPTWGNSTGGVDYFNTFDLNHFTFVKHGLDVSLPFAAGHYNLDSEPEDTVSVAFDTAETEYQAAFEIKVEPNPFLLTGFAGPMSLTIKNLGNMAIYPDHSKIEIENYGVPKNELHIGVILPWQEYTTQIWVEPPKPWYTQPEIVILELDEQKIESKITISPKTKAIFFIGVLSLGIVSTITSFGTWRLLVSRRK